MFDDLNVESYARFAYSELSRRIAELRRQLPHEAGEIVYLKHKSGHSYPSLRYRQNGKIKYKYIAKNKLDEVIAEQKQLQHYDMLLKQYLDLLAQAEKVLALFQIDKENPNSTVSAAPLSFLSSDRMLIAAKGHSVRSKSELLIADALFYHGIRYEYEKALILSGRTIYPDFTIYCSDGRINYWEHLGLLEDESYRQHWNYKKNLYTSNDIIENYNLIVSKDHNGSFDSRDIQHLIQIYHLK